MKNQKMITSILLVVIFVTTFVTPVEAANTVRAILNNTTGQAVTLYLYGNQSYTLDLKLGKNAVELGKGSYRYYYYACGQEFFGQFEVKKVKDTLEVSCNAVSSFATVDMIQFMVNNQTPFSFWLILDGEKDQRLYVVPGYNYFDVPQDTYKYNVSVCGKAIRGTVRALKGAPKITIRPCKTTSIRVQNQTGETAHIVITGMVTYNFDVGPGRTTIKIIPGSYRFTWFAGSCGDSFSFVLKGSSHWYWILHC